MRKFMFMLAAIAAMVVSAHVNDTKAFDNTYITIKGGATALMHPGCNGYENFGHSIEAATGLEIGKWVAPRWGFSIDGVNGWTNGSKFGMFQDDYTVNYVTVSALGKYRIPFNKFNIVAAVGPEWIHGFKKNAADANDLGAKAKIEFNFDLAKHLALQVAPELNYNMRHTAAIPTNTANQCYLDARRAWYGLMVGVTYKIGNEFTECDKKYTQAEWDALNAEVNALRARKPEVVEKEVETIVYKQNVQSTYIVAFDYNRADLDAAGRKVLDAVPANAIVEVKGEASNPGSNEYNQKLSEQRAKVVADYLTARGINVQDVKGLGATGHQVVTIVVK